VKGTDLNNEVVKISHEKMERITLNLLGYTDKGWMVSERINICI
jgi:hypothetical protein